MIEVKSQQQGSAAALYDARAAAFVTGWLAQRQPAGAGRRLLGGRGAVELLAPCGEPWVLRHYRRGGLVARLCRDHYLWTGAARTRCFREFRLLVELVAAGLPVPAPVAARYCRHGLTYRADLITVQLPQARTLAEWVLAGGFDAAMAAAVGHLVGRFHRAGVWHADLNAHNVLHSQGQWYLIDFDRGARRPPAAAWQQANLQRLQRSLLKLGAAQAQPVAWSQAWAGLQQAYREVMQG